ncbi:HET-domain-containing protein, partial [Thozetella sp. PMI_491]
MPTRVIHVGAQDAEGIYQEPYLCLGESAPGPWITLSHTWGGDDSCRLLKANLQARMAKIPLSELPQTFYDAVIITRKLNISYLWIDSLCIIQDDLQDWNIESAVMAKVYNYSVLTIAATSSSGPKHGILKSTAVVTGKPVKAITKDLNQATVFIEACLMDWYTAVESYNHSPLASRAWVLQEQVLSPRTIHFAEDQVYWECRESRLGQATGPVPPLQAHTSNNQSALESNLTRRGSQYTYHMFWEALVEKYTTRKLTKGRDILPAISALASVFQIRLNGSRYLAGLWEQFLPEGLSWRLLTPDSETNYEQTTGHETCRPSWSWTSVPHQVRFYRPYEDEDPEDHYRAQIVYARTVCQERTSPFGQIRGSCLRIRGLSTFVRIKGDPEYQGSGKHSVLILPVPTDFSDDENGAFLVSYSPTGSGMYKEHRESIFPVQNDGSLLYEKIQYEEEDDEIAPVCFTCVLDQPYEKARSAPGTWLSFHLLRVYDRAYLMLKECKDDPNKHHRIGLAVHNLTWCSPTWEE